MVRYCPKHGRQTRDGANYCAACGARLERRPTSTYKWMLALVALGAAVWVGFLQPRHHSDGSPPRRVIVEHETPAAGQASRFLALAEPNAPGAPPMTTSADAPVGKLKIRHYDRPLPTDTTVDVYLDSAGSYYAVVPVAREKLTTIQLGGEWTFRSLSTHADHRVAHKIDKSAMTLELWGRNNAGSSVVIYLERR